jgi:hypothetical protein
VVLASAFDTALSGRLLLASRDHRQERGNGDSTSAM